MLTRRAPAARPGRDHGAALAGVAVPVWGDEPARAGPRRRPVRLAVLFAGNGFHSKEWWAKGEGRSHGAGQGARSRWSTFKDKHALHPRPVQRRGRQGRHPQRQTGNLLTGAPLEGGGGIRSGVSMDQLLAQKIGQQTKVPSLVLGCEPSISALHKGYSMIYSSHISWSSPTTPTPLELYPALAFDRLFRDEVGQGDASVLDLVLEEARGLSNRISYTDRGKLDEYLDSVREVEQRIQQAGQARPAARLAADARQAEPAPRPPTACRRTSTSTCGSCATSSCWRSRPTRRRICTLKLNNDHSSLRFPHLGVDYMIHHLLSHTDNADWLKVNQFFTQQVAYIAGKLDKIQEGERTALDNTMLLYLSSMLHGSTTIARSCRWCMLGRGGGRIADRPGARLPGQAESQDVQPVPGA